MKYISFLLAVILLFSLSACGISSGGDASEDTTERGEVTTATTTCTHLWKSATCTEPKTCTKCGATDGVALGHTTNSGICTRCGQNFSAWKIGEYTDEFNQPTGKKYIVVDSYGKFSNSATTDSNLLAAVQIDKDNIGIMLWEYGRNLVKGIFDYENYQITILDEEGTKHSFTGTIYEGGTRVYFRSNDRNAVLSLFQSNDSLQIYLKSTKYSISTYLFAVDMNGFLDAYDLVK